MYIDKKQLGGLAALPFGGRLINKNKNNMLKKYQIGGLASFGEGEPNPLFSLSKEDQIDYFYELADYVNQYGEDALAQDPMAEEFFYNMLSSQKPSVFNGEPDPIEGGDYVEATIMGKRISTSTSDPIKEFISSPKIQSENFQNFSETKMPEILLEDYQVEVSSPGSLFRNDNSILSKLGITPTVFSPEIGKKTLNIKRIKTARNGGLEKMQSGGIPESEFVFPTFEEWLPSASKSLPNTSVDNLYRLYIDERAAAMEQQIEARDARLMPLNPLPRINKKLKSIKKTKNGGNIYSKLGIKPMGVFYQGGSVDPAFQRNMPVGNSKKINGYIPMESLIPIQTEKDELIVLPTRDVVKVNARKRHSKMTDDEVTDIVPDGSYILSQYGDVDIYKEEADNYIIETKNKPYNLNQQNLPPTVKTLGDFMNKKKMKPADLARKILSRYKTVNLDDPFAIDTNRANKYTASRYIDAIIELSEMDKKRKGIDNNIETQLYEQNPEMVARNGGRALKSSYNVPKAQDPLIGALAGLVGAGVSAWSDAQNRKLLKENTAASLYDIDRLGKQQMGMENISLGAALFNPQDTNYQEARQKLGYLQGLRNIGLGNQERDYFANRALANLGAVQTNKTYDPREAMAMNTAGYSSALDTFSKYALEDAKRKAGLEAQYYSALGAGLNANEAARINEQNIIRANANKAISDRVAALMGSATNRQNLLSNEAAMRLAARGQQTSGLMQLNNQLAQSLMNSASLGLQGYQTMANAQAAKAKADAEAKLLEAQTNYYNSSTRQPSTASQVQDQLMGLFVPGWRTRKK